MSHTLVKPDATVSLFRTDSG